MVRRLLIATLWFVSAALNAQEPKSNSSHGTVNIFLANRNGLVAVTDSRLSNKYGAQGSGQKLFQVDDRTICAIAGFYMDQGPTLGDFHGTPSHPGYLVISTILKEFFESDRKEGPRPSLSQKLAEISDSLIPILEVVANTNQVAGLTDEPASSEVTLAGYRNGALTISQTILIPTIEGGLIKYTSHPVPDIVVKEKLVYRTAGIDLMARSILDSPKDAIVQNPINGRPLRSKDVFAENLKESLAENGGADLSTDELLMLAKDLERRTAETVPVVVGGDIQSSILEGGAVKAFDQPVKGEAGGHGLTYSHYDTNYFENAGPSGNPINHIYLYVTRSVYENSFVLLDEGIFIEILFKSSLLSYQGSKEVLFDTRNDVTNSVLELGPDVSQNDPFVGMMKKRYPNMKIEMGPLIEVAGSFASK